MTSVDNVDFSLILSAELFRHSVLRWPVRNLGAGGRGGGEWRESRFLKWSVSRSV
ncbi:hypothetical protein HanRHA438_Chr15g0684981 [Helianthus annuus]|nr:hypothetical protein HanRHA438_Chr15g0684981 [Helianthus annuus]